MAHVPLHKALNLPIIHMLELRSSVRLNDTCKIGLHLLTCSYILNHNMFFLDVYITLLFLLQKVFVQKHFGKSKFMISCLLLKGKS